MSWEQRQVFGVLVGINLGAIALNALPLAPLDGATAWQLAGYGLRRLRARADRAWDRRRARREEKKRANAAMAEIRRLRAGRDDVDVS